MPQIVNLLEFFTLCTVKMAMPVVRAKELFAWNCTFLGGAPVDLYNCTPKQVQLEKDRRHYNSLKFVVDSLFSYYEMDKMKCLYCERTFFDFDSLPELEKVTHLAEHARKRHPVPYVRKYNTRITSVSP